jgi:acid phosphatase type 7
VRLSCDFWSAMNNYLQSYLCSDSVGWSDTTKFRTPPAGGSDELSFVIFGDMGKAPLDPSVEHYIQVR